MASQTFRTETITKQTKDGDIELQVRVHELPNKVGIRKATECIEKWVKNKMKNANGPSTSAAADDMLRAAMLAATKSDVFKGPLDIRKDLITTAWNAFTMVRYLECVPNERQSVDKSQNKGANQSPFRAHQSRVESEISGNPELRFGMAIHATGTGKTCTMIAALRGLASRGADTSSGSGTGARTRRAAAKDDARRAAKPITQFVFVAPNSSIRDQIIDSLKYKCSGMPDLVLTTNDECNVWSGLELRSRHLANGVVRVAFVTQNTLADMANAPMDWAWPSKSSAAVFVDEAHKFFLNSSIPKHLEELCGEQAEHVSPLLLSTRATDRAILWLSGAAFVLAATATPYQNTPNDISFYLDCLSYMTYPRPSTDSSMISVVGRVVHEDDPENPERAERLYWSRLKTAWASSLVHNKGFVSYYMPEEGGDMPNVNYSRLPFNLGISNASRVPLRGAWMDRVVSIPVTDVQTLQRLRTVEAGMRPLGPSGQRSVVELMPLYKIINPIKVPKMLEVAEAQYARDKGPVMFFSNFIDQGTKLLADALRQRGCIEIIPSGKVELSPVYGFINWLAANLRDPQNAEALTSPLLMQKASSVFARLAGYAAAVRYRGLAQSGNNKTHQQIKRNHSWATWMRKLIPPRPRVSDPEHLKFERTFSNKLIYMEEMMRAKMPNLPENGVFIRIEGATPDDRILAIKYIFNAPANHAGDFIKYAVISKAGATGIDYKNIKQVHIMDSDFLPTTLIQAVGRATRQGSLAASAAETKQRGTVRMYAYATYVPSDSANVPAEYRGMRTVNLQTYNSTALKFKHSVDSMHLLNELSIEKGGARLPAGTSAVGICRAHHFENSVPPPRVLPRPRAEVPAAQPETRRRSRVDDDVDPNSERAPKRQRSDLANASRKQGGSGSARASKAVGGRDVLLRLFKRNRDDNRNDMQT